MLSFAGDTKESLITPRKMLVTEARVMQTLQCSTAGLVPEWSEGGSGSYKYDLWQHKWNIWWYSWTLILKYNIKTILWIKWMKLNFPGWPHSCAICVNNQFMCYFLISYIKLTSTKIQICEFWIYLFQSVFVLETNINDMSQQINTTLWWIMNQINWDTD